MRSALRKVYRFYADGFRSMTVGRTLWLIVLLKLFLLFAVLKPFFFRTEPSGADRPGSGSRCSNASSHPPNNRCL